MSQDTSYLQEETRRQRRVILHTHPEFHSLLVPIPVKKRRKCLRCNISFVSSHNGFRFCGSCRHRNATSTVRSSVTYKTE